MLTRDAGRAMTAALFKPARVAQAVAGKLVLLTADRQILVTIPCEDSNVRRAVSVDPDGTRADLRDANGCLVGCVTGKSGGEHLDVSVWTVPESLQSVRVPAGVLDFKAPLTEAERTAAEATCNGIRDWEVETGRPFTLGERTYLVNRTTGDWTVLYTGWPAPSGVWQMAGAAATRTQAVDRVNEHHRDWTEFKRKPAPPPSPVPEWDGKFADHKARLAGAEHAGDVVGAAIAEADAGRDRHPEAERVNEAHRLRMSGPDRQMFKRSEELLVDTLSLVCRAVWNKGAPVGIHLWSIPVDYRRDFDCILADAIDELVARRAAMQSHGIELTEWDVDRSVVPPPPDEASGEDVPN